MKKQNNLLGKYVDMCTDFGMKLYFGPRSGKENLIHFLNGLFAGEKVIRDLEYRPTERIGEQEHNRKVIFDLYCTSDDNSHFIIEMQQLPQDFFRDRMVYYSSRLIHTLVPRGYSGNTYELPEVYFIGILNFALDNIDNDRYYYDVVLCDREKGEQFYDKLGFKLLCLPNFRKEEVEIKSFMDMWLYLFKHMSQLNEIPKFLDKRVFGLIFDIGEVSNLNSEDMKAYELSLKDKRDAESIRLTAERIGMEKGMEKGMKKGIEKGRQEERAKAEAEKRISALKMLKSGFDSKVIADIIGLSIEEIEKLK